MFPDVFSLRLMSLNPKVAEELEALERLHLDELQLLSLLGLFLFGIS